MIGFFVVSLRPAWLHAVCSTILNASRRRLRSAKPSLLAVLRNSTPKVLFAVGCSAHSLTKLVSWKHGIENCGLRMSCERSGSQRNERLLGRQSSIPLYAHC